MFSFKNELAKFSFLPELDEISDAPNDNNIEDIMDILHVFEKSLADRSDK